VTIRHGGWPRSGGAILFFVLFATLAAACAPSAPSSGVPSASGAAPSPTTADQGAADLFASAFAPLRAAAEFTTTVTVGDAVVATSTGRVIAGSSQLTVTSDARTVEYVQVPPKAWARESGGTWVLLTPDQAPGDPLAALGAPSSVSASDAGSAGPSASPGAGGSPSAVLHLTAVYPAAALGLSGDPVTVTIVIDAGSLTFRYETTVGEKPASSVTVLHAAATSDPIVPPTP